MKRQKVLYNLDQWDRKNDSVKFEQQKFVVMQKYDRRVTFLVLSVEFPITSEGFELEDKSIDKIIGDANIWHLYDESFWWFTKVQVDFIKESTIEIFPQQKKNEEEQKEWLFALIYLASRWYKKNPPQFEIFIRGTIIEGDVRKLNKAKLKNYMTRSELLKMGAFHHRKKKIGIPLSLNQRQKNSNETSSSPEHQNEVDKVQKKICIINQSDGQMRAIINDSDSQNQNRKVKNTNNEKDSQEEQKNSQNGPEIQEIQVSEDSYSNRSSFQDDALLESSFRVQNKYNFLPKKQLLYQVFQIFDGKKFFNEENKAIEQNQLEMIKSCAVYNSLSNQAVSHILKLFDTYLNKGNKFHIHNINIMRTLSDDCIDNTVHEHHIKNLSQEKIHLFPIVNKTNASLLVFDPKTQKVTHIQSRLKENGMFNDLKDKIIPFLTRCFADQKMKSKKWILHSSSIQQKFYADQVGKNNFQVIMLRNLHEILRRGKIPENMEKLYYQHEIYLYRYFLAAWIYTKPVIDIKKSKN